MSAHGQTPSVNAETPQEEQEQSAPTYEEKLAGKLEEGFGQEQQLTIQATLALIFGASTHALEIRSSLKLLRGDIDINRLINDPRYKAEIERAVQLTNRYGRIVKKGELVDIVPRVETALTRVEILHGQTGKVKKDLSPQYEIEMRQAYGLSDEQLKTVREKALERIRENPKLSMRDALRMEAREILVKTVEKEVKDDKNVKRGDRKKEAEKRLDAKDKAFLEHPQTAKIHGVETEFCDRINNRGVEAIKETLGKEVRPTPPSIPPSAAIPLGKGFRFPGFALPAELTQGLGRLGSFFGGLGGGFGAQVGSFLGNGTKSLLGSGGLLSKGISAGLNLAKTALPRLASFALPPLGAAITAITAVDALTGGLITKGAALAVGAVAAIVIVVPIIIGVGVFSYVTGDNPLKLSYSTEKTIGWNEFNKQSLSINNNDNQLSWKQFEKENLTLNKNYLSLYADRHDDVKK